MHEKSKPCPNCGHCPTCGKSNRGPYYPWYPNPWGGYRYPYTWWSSGSPNTSGGYTITSSSNSEVMN